MKNHSWPPDDEADRYVSGLSDASRGFLPTHPSLSQTSLLSAGEEIAPARDAIDDWLRAKLPGISSVRRGDIVLAASELFSNAFEHGQGECLYDLRCVHDQLLLTVTNAAIGAEILPTEWWTMADVSERTGRGLAIVRAVADSVHVNTTDSSVVITAVFALTTTPPAPARRAAVAV